MFSPTCALGCNIRAFFSQSNPGSIRPRMHLVQFCLPSDMPSARSFSQLIYATYHIYTTTLTLRTC